MNDEISFVDLNKVCIQHMNDYRMALNTESVDWREAEDF